MTTWLEKVAIIGLLFSVLTARGCAFPDDTPDGELARFYNNNFRKGSKENLDGYYLPHWVENGENSWIKVWSKEKVEDK